MGDHNTAGEAAVVRAVRALDHGDTETIPDRLERVWDILQDYRGGSFHAAEEMLLRWLLKNMAGSSANAERVRRYPRVWDILATVFALIPLFSLAKSLANRRFVGLLQQTLKDIAAPQQETRVDGADSDVDMADAPPPESPANPRKRKRPDAAGFNVASQRQDAGCLQTAEAVFDAVRVLLSRCELKSLDGPATHRMGAEHVKSLFSTSAADTMGLLVPWLAICGLALDRPKVEPQKEQVSWLSTFAALWKLHLQSATDVSEVATHLSGTATRILGKLTGIPQQTPLGIEAAVQERWARDLRRFLARNLILPARAVFLTSGGQDIVKITVGMSSASAQITFPVLFDLVSKSPLESGAKTSRKDYETWVQAVFDAVMHAAKNASRENKMVAVRCIMEMAAERGTFLSAASLRAVCNDYALRKDTYDWSLLLAIIKLNPDVFLITDEGKQLLEQVLEKTKEPDSLVAEDSEKAAQFIVLLANGHAQARDLSTFIRVWLKHLAPAKPKAGLQPLWAQKELADSVAELIQSSLNSTQLVEVLEWLSSQTQPTESMARIHILEAISTGITQEEFVDAANVKTFEGAFLEKHSKKDLPTISACRWMVASKAIARGTLREADQIWSQIKSDIKSSLRKSPIDRVDTFAAFRCCVAAWLANHPGAAHEDDAATFICSFVERIEKENEPIELDSDTSEFSVRKGTYLSWILSDAPRLLSLLVDRNGSVPNGILSLLTVPGSEDAAPVDSALAVSRLLLERESNVNNQKLMDLLIDTVISMVDTSKAGRSGPSTKIAMEFLLGVPIEVLSRTQREAAMKSLVTHLPRDSDKVEAVGPEYWRLALSLMVKVMGRPTFYEGMSFSHLESIGRCLLKKRSNRRSRQGLPTDDEPRDRDNFKLLQQLAVLAIRQMTNGSPEEREKTYLKDAISLFQSPCQDSDAVPRIVLLQAFITTVQASSAVKKLEEDGVDLGSLKNQLLQIASSAVTSGNRTGKGTLALLVVALEALNDLDRQTVRQALASAVPSLLETSDSLLENGLQAGWEVRMFVANHFPEALESPLKIKMPGESLTSSEENEKAESSESAATLGKTALLRYVDAVVRSADEDTKLGYLKELLREDGDGQDALGRQLVIYRLIQHLKGSKPSDSPDRFDLAQAHSILCNRLARTTTPPHFLLTAKAIHLLLDQTPACMTQWNIELTLSTVSTLASHSSTQALLATSPSIYPSLCRLVEMVIKRHRRRLDGHFHILITALQSLLHLLLSRPPQPSPTPTVITTPHGGGTSHQEKHAKLFSRLLTLICEPTVASVSSRKTTTAGGGGGGGGSGPLDSEKDRARRYAGQFMYLVLMQYVRLQLAHAPVPHGVREALEPGVYAVLDVTTGDGMRIMSDGMDASGRVVFREMFRLYQRFGKWSGV
ncbi:nucleolar pre-ribosomal-associated protein 2 [Parachaetomium inaequale]|uniref:Nucleolar pre-ribosomal-associated protein 2 n=1 Tax=Parachaetomium inaequale TaxID=2588326 RepID=A0AAN6SRB3_9PEZI|nr:nucleolar pre-ribosomal-associated protein 2 [Parachaetomium inaequale]